MIARLIITGKNRDFPRYVDCMWCNGDGQVTCDPINPSEKPFEVRCERCNGQGRVERKAS